MGDEVHLAKVRAAEKLHEKARYLRGRFLNSVALIERDIAIILTEYFCTDDESIRNLFYDKIAARLTLQKKKEILIDVVRNDYPLYWEDKKVAINNLQQIQEFRNKLAHSVIDVSDEALMRPLEEGIGFVQWEKGRPITDQEFEDWDVKANMVVSTLRDIRKPLPFKQTPA